MRDHRRLARIALALGVAFVLGAGTLWLLHLHATRQETARLVRVTGEVAQLPAGIPPCAAGEECGCDIPAGGAFTKCRVVDGYRALAIASNDECFSQWYAVEHIWPDSAGPRYLGREWVSRPPRRIAAGWSLLAVAPCAD